jgi:hypothetical protein
VGYVEGHKYAGQDELQRVARSAILSRGTDLTHATIFGDFIFWPAFKDLSFEWSPSAFYNPLRIPPGKIYLICDLDSPFSPEERVCADELPIFADMQFVAQFFWAGRKYR